MAGLAFLLNDSWQVISTRMIISTMVINDDRDNHDDYDDYLTMAGLAFFIVTDHWSW